MKKILDFLSPYRSSQSVEFLLTGNKREKFQAQQIVIRRSKRGMVTTEVLKVILDVKAQTEEDVVPDKELATIIVRRIDRRNTAIHHALSAADRHLNEVKLGPHQRALSLVDFLRRGVRQVAERLQLLIPIAALKRNHVLVALGAEKFRLRERVLPAEHVPGRFGAWENP